MTIERVITSPRLGEKLLRQNKIAKALVGRFLGTGKVGMLVSIRVNSINEAKRLHRLTRSSVEFLIY